MKRLKRYRYPLIGVALLVLFLAVWNGLQFFSTSSRINSANFAKIKKGMTYDELDSIIGNPDYMYGSTSGPISSATSSSWAIWFESRDPPWWAANNRSISVLFTDGRVIDSSLKVETRSLKDRFAKYLP